MFTFATTTNNLDNCQESMVKNAPRIPRRFVISATEAKSLAEDRKLTLPELLPTLVPLAQSLSRAPISNYHVGAVGLGMSGRIYFGANLEFPGLPLHHSVHAEQFLVTVAAAMSADGDTTDQITHIAVSSVPCGHCRQFLQELRSASDILVLVTSSSAESHPSDSSSSSSSSSSSRYFLPYTRLSALLPHPFGPTDLLHDGAPLLLESQNNNIILEEEGREWKDLEVICNGGGKLLLAEEKAKKAAKNAAKRAHAPYSSCPSGFAVVDKEGRVFAGSYSESAAYNPSLGPVQAAMIAFVAGDGEYQRIVTAALVERKGCLVSQESTARILLEKVAPNCNLGVYHCLVK